MRGPKPSEITAGTLAEVPRPPSWLSREFKAEWKRILPDLIERRALSVADMGAVEDLCVARGLVRQIEREMRKLGRIDPVLCRLQDKATATALRLAAEIGATPVARTRAGSPKDERADTSFCD